MNVDLNITLDIETIPAQDETLREELVAEHLKGAVQRSTEIEAEIAAIKPPANFKDNDKIVAWEATERPKKVKKLRDEQAVLDHAARQKADDAWRKTSFDGALGHLAVLGYAVNDGEPIVLWRKNYLDDVTAAETWMLREFFVHIEMICTKGAVQRLPTIIGHRVRDFDLRFLYQRAVILGVRPTRWINFNAAPWDDCLFDTMNRWTGGREPVALDKLCKVLGIATKGTEIGEEIDGAKVWDFIKEGRIEDVATYCGADVKRARDVWKRMTFWQPLMAEADRLMLEARKAA
jgi:hypothetical protein